MKTIAKAKAHGKIILVGEHSVVFGGPAIAIPIRTRSVNVTVELSDEASTLHTDIFTGRLENIPNSLTGVHTLIKHLIQTLSLQSKNFKVIITSDIPMNRGMGSSAAVSVAIIRAFYELVELKITPLLLREHAFISESIHHNSPSGLDVETVIGNSPIFFIRDEVLRHFDVKTKAFLVIGDTGITGSTSEAVVHFKSELKKIGYQAKLDRLKVIASNSYDSLINNRVEVLGGLMNEAHEILREFGVSNYKLDDFVKVALANGALGAKLTGSGMGGCMIALCRNKSDAENVSQSLKLAGATEVVVTRLEDSNE